MKHVTLRYQHSQLGLAIKVLSNDEWKLVELVSASNFRTLNDQFAFMHDYTDHLRSRGYAVTVR